MSDGHLGMGSHQSTQSPIFISSGGNGMTDGWIKFYRKFLDWEWYQDGSMVRLFLHLLLIANHKTKRWRGIDINPGQVVTGRYTLSEETGLSEQTVRTCLAKLKSTSEITIKSTNKFSVITIGRWDDYQGTGKELTSKTTGQLTNDQPATNQQLTTTKNVKKEKKTDSKLTDQEWFAYLLSNPAYKGIDIELQRGKCEAWCLTNRKPFTRKRFVNWLNRADKPLTTGRPKGYFENI